MAEPLRLPEDEGPRTEQVLIGEQVFEVDPEVAAAHRAQVEGLASQYGAQLERFRAEMLQRIGTQSSQPMPQFQPQTPESYLGVPDPDLLFKDKDQWSHGLQASIDDRLMTVEQRHTAQMQGLSQAFQAELNRRDQAAAAQKRHDEAMEEMLTRRGLEENRLIVQAVYNEEYGKLQHLPLEMALDKIGARAVEEIQKVRSGEKWTIERGRTESAAPKPPPVLRSARRAAPAAAPQPQAPPQGLPPNGDLGPMGSIILKRQQQLLRG